MITFTDAGDTASSVTHRLLGHNDESFAKNLWEANANSFARTMNSAHSTEFAPNFAVWVPGFSVLDEQPEVYQSLIRRTEFIPSAARAKLVHLQRHGVDLNHLLGASKALKVHNKNHQQRGEAIASLSPLSTGKEVVTRTAERASIPGEKFSDAMKELNEKLEKLNHLKQSGASTAEIRDARDELKAAKKEAEKVFKKSGELYAKKLSTKSNRYLNTANHIEKQAAKKGIMIYDL